MATDEVRDGGGIVRFGDDRDWFLEKRYGMFIHWGLYSIRGWHEQEQQRDKIDRTTYGEYAKAFDPTDFDPEAWLDLAQESGMEYICFTTKHHDGFCMWDTDLTDFNIMNTPYGKDVLGMLAEACHRRGMPLCLYYSCVDWHHPNYPNGGRHHELEGPLAGDEPDLEKYLGYLKGQISELCTGYGEISGIFWDMNVPKHVDESINGMIRQLQPKAVINDRGYDPGDYGTPERDYDNKSIASLRRFTKPTEACQSVGMESWGYRIREDYYTPKYIMQSMARILCMGGNYLLNVGPDSLGRIPEKAAEVLKGIAEWLTPVRKAVYGTEPASHLVDAGSAYATRRGDTLYVFLCEDPKGTAVSLPPLTVLPRRATLLNDGTGLEAVLDRGTKHYSEPDNPLIIRGIPPTAGYGQVPVLELEFEPGTLGD